LVAALERGVDAADDRGDAGRGVERLIRIHGKRVVRVGRYLPTGKIDRRHARLDLLHGLVAGERAQRIHEGAFVHEVPELLGAAARERVLDLDAASQAIDVLCGISAANAFPPGVVAPVLPDSLHFQVTRAHRFLLLVDDSSTRWKHRGAANRNWYFG